MGQGVPESEEPSLGDVDKGSNYDTLDVCANETDTDIVDLYGVGGPESRRTTPFACSVEFEGPRGEVVRAMAMKDDGAQVAAMDSVYYEERRHRLGPLRPSTKRLRMANGHVMSSEGRWEGMMRVAGARTLVAFEVFPSGGNWQFLLGKPLLESLRVIHDYASDTVRIPTSGEPIVIAN
ncbi:hypothetical protein GGG16DRAFT_48927, partial [Schizophyllum commune]